MLKPETIAANKARQRYPITTLAPDPEQSELQLTPRERCPTAKRFADMCPRCHCVHVSDESRNACTGY